MAKIQAELLVYLLIGVYAQKTRIFSAGGRRCLIDYLLKIALPCMIFESFHQQVSGEQAQSAVFMLAVAFAVSTCSVLLGKLIWRKVPAAQQAVLQYGTLVSNAGFAGIPLVERVCGSVGMFYASIYVIPTRIFMWTAGVSLFTQATSKEKCKSVLLNPGIIAVVLGIVRMLLNFPLPVFLDSAVKSVGSGTTALSMIIVGAILADVPLKSIWDKRLFALAGVRLLLIPGLLLVVLKLFRVDPVAVSAGVMLTGMPVGATTTLLAEKYGADHGFASKCVFVSTVLSLVTIPILSLFINGN